MVIKINNIGVGLGEIFDNLFAVSSSRCSGLSASVVVQIFHCATAAQIHRSVTVDIFLSDKIIDTAVVIGMHVGEEEIVKTLNTERLEIIGDRFTIEGTINRIAATSVYHPSFALTFDQDSIANGGFGAGLVGILDKMHAVVGGTDGDVVRNRDGLAAGKSSAVNRGGLSNAGDVGRVGDFEFLTKDNVFTVGQSGAVADASDSGDVSISDFELLDDLVGLSGELDGSGVVTSGEI